MKIVRNYKSSILLLMGMLVGSVIGIIMKEKASIFQPIADMFLNLLYCIVVPMVFISLVAAIAKMTDLKKLGKILSIMMVLFVVTGIVAAVYMAIVVTLFDPTKGANLAMNEVISDVTGNSNFLSMFTVGDFYLLLSRRSLMALIVFSVTFGVAIAALKEKVQIVVTFFDALLEVVMKVVGYIMKLAPFGLGAFFATLVGQYGSSIAGPLSRSIIIYFVAAIIYYFVSNSVFALIGGGVEGFKVYWKNIVPPTLTALGTCSSAASIPTNLVAAKNIGLSDEIANLTIPLGANLHKDGAVLIQILKIAFMCNIYGINFLDPKIFLTAVFVSVLASCVMGAIPAGGYVGEIFIIAAFGFPPESIPIMVLIGTITDAPATAINVTGDIGMAMILNKIMDGKKWMAAKLSLNQD